MIDDDDNDTDRNNLTNESRRVRLIHNFGLNSSRRDNASCVCSDTTFAFACGNLVQFLNIRKEAVVGDKNKNSNTSNTFMLARRSNREIGMIAINPKRTFMAIGEGNSKNTTTTTTTTTTAKIINNENKKLIDEEDSGANVDIYDYPSLELKKTLVGGAKSKYALGKFSPDGTMLATVSSAPDYVLTVWDWENECSILRCKAFSQEIYGLSFSPFVSGQLTTWGTSHVRFWKMADTFTGLKLHGSLGKFGAEPLSDICATCESDDGKITLSGTTSGSILAWSGGMIETKFCIDEDIMCHDGTINSMNLRKVVSSSHADDGKQYLQLLTTGEDGFVRAWDADAIWDIVRTPENSFVQKIKPIFEYHLGSFVNSTNLLMTDFDETALNCNNNKCIIQNAYGSLLELDLSNGKSRDIFQAHSGAITGCDVSFLSTHFFTTGHDKTVRCYEYSERKLLFTSRFHASGTVLKVFPKKVDTSSRLVLVGFADGVVRVLFRTDTAFKVLESVKPHTNAIVSIDWNSDGSKFATASKDKTIFLFDVEAKGKLKPIGFVQLDKIPKRIEYDTSDTDTTYTTNNRVNVYFEKAEPIKLVSTKLLKIGSAAGDTFELEASFVSMGKQTTSIIKDEVFCSHTSNSGRFQVQGFADGSVSIRCQEEGEEHQQQDWIEKKEVHVSKITGVAITYDDRFLVSASEDGSLLLFDLGSNSASPINKKEESGSESELLEKKSDVLVDYGKGIAEDIEIDEFPSLQRAKTLARELQISKDAEKTKNRCMERLNELRKDFKSLVEANKQLSNDESLPESAFEVDADLLGNIENKTERNIERAEREMAWRLEKAELVLKRLESRYYDGVEAHREELHARFDKSNNGDGENRCTFSCESFSLKMVAKDDFMDDDEDIEGKNMFDEFVPPGNASILSDETSTIMSNVEAPRVSDVYDESGREKSDLTSQEIRRIERQKRAEEMAAFELTRPIDASEMNIEEDVEIINARNEISDFPLKSDPSAKVVKEKRAIVELKEVELNKVNEKIREIKVTFNAKFQALKTESSALNDKVFNEKLRELSLSKAIAARKCKALELQRFIVERELEIIEKKHDADNKALEKKLQAAEELMRANKIIVKKSANSFKERESILNDANNALQNLTKVYENSLPPGAPRAKLLKIFMRDVEYNDLEKCPIGCEEEIYERVLNLRSKRRELEDSKTEAMKESEEAKMFLDGRRKEMEDAAASLKEIITEIEAFEKKKQEDLNGLDIYITLKTHEILHFDVDLTHTGISTVKLGSSDNGLVFARSDIEKLKYEIEHLNVDISLLKKSQQELKKQFVALEIERKEEEAKERDLEAKEIDVQMRKFGQIVDLDALDAMAREARGGEELKIKLRAQETFHAKEAAEWRRLIQESNDEFTALIEQHTLLLQKIASEKREKLFRKRVLIN